MQRSRARSAALASGFALLFSSTALTAPTAALAQAQAEVVQRIAVRGNERIEQATVLSYLPIQPGDRVDAAQLDLALKALYRTDLFADVRISAVGGEVIVEVVENPIINRVIFEGNRGLKEDKLRDEVTLRPRGIFTRARIQQDVQRIVELYRRSGRISANVTPKIVELPQKRVDVIFEIDEGAKSGVLRTNFIGNVEFSDNDLRDVVVTEQSAWYKLFSSNANYDPDRLEYDKEQLREHYRNRGFYDFRVVSAIAELSPDKNGFVVTYTVEEGPEYKFGNVEVATELEKLNKETLVQILPIREGQIYQDERIEQATDTLTFAAGAAGFAFVDVRPRYTPNRETRTVDVTFQVNEGPRVYVERIDIIGNTRTLDYVVRREMNLAEGDAYNRVLVDRSRNRIRALGFFKDVTIEEVPGSAPDRTGLQVQVEEQPTGELSFSAGYSSVDQLILDLGVTERNFRGRGQNVRARVSVGSLRQQVDFSFTEPRFMGRDLGAGVDLYSYRYDLTDYSAYRTNTIGGGVRLGFPLTLNARASARYTLRRDEVEIPASFCDPNAAVVSISLCQQRGAYTTSLVGYGVRLDRRNDPINPTRGFYTALNQDLAGVGGDVNYLKTEVEGGIYYGFSPSFILSATGSAGYVDGWNGDTVRINERFYKGGNSFRGFETAGIGARDLNSARGDALGGKAYAIGSVELTVPTFLPEQYGVKAALFSDFGTLGMLDDEDKLTVAGAVDPNIVDDLSLRASAGVSIFWRSPMGPIRFDFSQVLAKEDYDKTETFRFSTSTRF
ncbi:outer membrane protein assembly factor BamA [Phenylobacterium sp.]|jgi:outer membrane protein insertion porin family|uniref:outer membrane protein assembly factor BamA n=1 Tax=Phenylobacterium sp. TaxID=1871053 RepID=UPI000C928823|nr:outer membrane protein assembly factor BamA [Phenylobacterium sp.]MAK83218.1 outer membrane protein assembly factor BamA [Phenylobacterium sp.]|tara:strand:+ start:143586 stop:145940 length:2355 start_codon:yes stop_codon:yes gene_type:complete